jgi:hypothetical protein
VAVLVDEAPRVVVGSGRGQYLQLRGFEGGENAVEKWAEN